MRTLGLPALALALVLGTAACDEAREGMRASSSGVVPEKLQAGPSPTAATGDDDHPPSARAVLAAGIDGLRARDHGTLSHVLLYEGGAAVDVGGGYLLGQRAFDLRARLRNPLKPQQESVGEVVGRGRFVVARGFGLLGGACWVPMRPPAFAQLFGMPGDQIGLADIDVLDDMHAVRWNPTSQVVDARLSATTVVHLFDPHAPRLAGTVPLAVTVVDGVVEKWEVVGTDLWAAVDRERPAGWKSLGWVWDASFSASFSDEDPGAIALPRKDVAPSLRAGCDAQGRSA